MAKCLNCGKWGLWLKLNDHGLCEECEMAVNMQNHSSSSNNSSLLYFQRVQMGQTNFSTAIRGKESDILRLLRKYTTESDELFHVNTLHYTPLSSSHIPQDELYNRLDSVVMNRLYKVSNYKTWIRDSTKPEIYFANYEDLLFTLSELSEFEPYFSFYKPTPSETKNEYIRLHSELTGKFIERWWDSVLNQAAGLKTLKGRQERIQKCQNKLMLYRKYLSAENINLYDQLTRGLTDMENIKPREKKSPEFDSSQERIVLNQLRMAQKIIDRHFSLIQVQDFYYKYRNTDRKYLDLCVKYCLEDINLLDQLNEEYVKEERAAIQLLIRQFGSVRQIDQERLDMVNKYGFRGTIPAWKRICIIYEKDNKYNEALNFCTDAIHYYTKHGISSEVEEFEKRKDKLKSKIFKSVRSMPTTETHENNPSVGYLDIDNIFKNIIGENNYQFIHAPNAYIFDYEKFRLCIPDYKPNRYVIFTKSPSKIIFIHNLDELKENISQLK